MSKKTRPSSQPTIPGQKCPAVRNAKVSDPKVRSLGGGSGRRTCGKCGRPNVKVQQSCNDEGYPMTAWYYNAHDVPVRDV